MFSVSGYHSDSLALLTHSKSNNTIVEELGTTDGKTETREIRNVWKITLFVRCQPVL